MSTSLLIVELAAAIFVVSMLFIITRNLKSYEFEKKFSDFSLLSENDEDVSFFESLTSMCFIVVYKISKIISVSQVIKKHSEKYDADAKVNGKIRNGLDFISLKILCAIFVSLLTSGIMIIKGFSINIPKVLLIFIIGYFLPNILITYKRNKRRKRIEDDLLKAIIIMNNSFKSGRNIMQAIETVKNELSGPIADEFKKISLDISYGLSLDTVFNRFYNRVKIEDAKYIASSLTLLNKTGGNIIKVFSMIEDSFFDKKKLKNELDSLTASSIFVYRVLVVLPIIFVVLISILNRDYFKPLVSSFFGGCILTIIISLYVIYIVVIKKVLKVGV